MCLLDRLGENSSQLLSSWLRFMLSLKLNSSTDRDSFREIQKENGHINILH